MDLNSTFNNEKLPKEYNIDFSSIITSASELILARANFYRTQFNTDIILSFSLGPAISLAPIYQSIGYYIPSSSFNSTVVIAEVNYPNDNSVQILEDLKFIHDVTIYYKLTKDDNSNFTNHRNLRIHLVRADNSIYDASIYSDTQSFSSMRDYAFIKGGITHALGDIVKLRFEVVQDNQNADASDTKLIIFSITWNIVGIKN